MNQQGSNEEQLDRLSIAEIILRERTARDSGLWEEMASYYHPESEVEVSWFRGSGAEFVQRTKIQWEATRTRSDEADRINFHEMGAAVVTVRNNRAIAETACTLHSFFPLDGVACKNTSFVRLMWRVQRWNGSWLIAGLRCMYIRDFITSCNPRQIPHIEQAELDQYRPSYRFTSYHLSRLGLHPKDDLPGTDRPDTIVSLRQGERAWLEQWKRGLPSSRSNNLGQENQMSTTKSLDELKMGQTDVPVDTLLLRRWSPRAFTQDPVSDGDLASIFTAAAWAASSYNEQPWRFVVGRTGDPTWQIIFDALLPFNQSWAVAAPVLYASFAKKTFTKTGDQNSVTLHDVGAASANASLQATALGLHTHGLAGFSAEQLRSALAVPDDFDPVACWALGRSGDPAALAENYKAMELAPRARKALNEFVYGAWEVPALP